MASLTIELRIQFIGEVLKPVMGFVLLDYTICLKMFFIKRYLFLFTGILLLLISFLLSSQPMDIQVHDTYYVMSGRAVFGSLV